MSKKDDPNNNPPERRRDSVTNLQGSETPLQSQAASSGASTSSFGQRIETTIAPFGREINANAPPLSHGMMQFNEPLRMGANPYNQRGAGSPSAFGHFVPRSSRAPFSQQLLPSSTPSAEELSRMSSLSLESQLFVGSASQSTPPATLGSVIQEIHHGLPPPFLGTSQSSASNVLEQPLPIDTRDQVVPGGQVVPEVNDKSSSSSSLSSSLTNVSTLSETISSSSSMSTDTGSGSPDAVPDISSTTNQNGEASVEEQQKI